MFRLWVSFVVTGLVSLLSTANAQTPANNLPVVEVSNIRQVFHNGEHNAFTDLVEFGGRYFLAFRSCPDGHMVHPTASIVILRSDDLQRWQPVHQFSVADRDTRDPHFLVFKDRLFVYTGTWYSGKTTLPRDQYDLNLHLGYGVSTADGSQWTQPQMLEGTFGHYIWRAAAHGGKAFLCARRKIDFEVLQTGEGRQVESLLLESDDGIVWKQRAVLQPIQGDETAFQFDRHGGLIGIGRRGNDKAQLLRSQPPYDTWQRSDLPAYIGGPLLARWDGHWLVGGRRLTDQGPRTTLYWLDGDQLQPFAQLPSGGDNSYPGFLELSPTQGVVSWYSSHETDNAGQPITAIYMADLTIRP